MPRSEKFQRWMGIALLAIALDASAVRADIDPTTIRQITCKGPDSTETIDMPTQTWTETSNVPVPGVPPIIYTIPYGDLDGTREFKIPGEYSEQLSRAQKPQPPVIYSWGSTITLDTHDTKKYHGLAKDAYRTGIFGAIIERHLISGQRKDDLYLASCHFVLRTPPNPDRDPNSPEP